MALSRSVVAERLLGLASLSALFGVVTTVDERARAYVASVTTNPSAEFAIVAGQASRMAHSALEAAGLQAVDHTVLVVFGLASLGLVLMMLRT